MMRKLLLAVLMFLTGLSVQSQVTFRPGIRAGLNLATLTQTEFNRRADLYAGAFYLIKFKRVYAIQPEISYSRQGSAGSTNFHDASTDATVTLDGDISIEYVSLTVQNKFYFTDNVIVQLGPIIDFEINSNVATNSDVDIGIMGGIGYALPNGLTIEARVKKGIIDVLDSDVYNNSFNESYVRNYNTNYLFQLGLSYSFDVAGSE